MFDRPSPVSYRRMFAMPTSVHWGDPVYLIKGFDPQLILQTLQKEKITIFGAVPAILAFMRLVPSWQSYDFSSLKTILVFAAPVPVPLIQEYAAGGVVVRQLYGLTECTGPATVIGPEEAVKRAGSCGKAFFHTEVKVVDDQGRETKPREPGSGHAGRAHHERVLAERGSHGGGPARRLDAHGRYRLPR